jgi:hypothetical protein
MTLDPLALTRLLHARLCAVPGSPYDSLKSLAGEGGSAVILRRGDLEAFILLWSGGGQAIVGEGEGRSQILNSWHFQTLGEGEDLVAALWAQFWAHEQKNLARGLPQWMHGPDLPRLPLSSLGQRQ